jgi:Asp-tRNA(Asn)/Glu-tRNA(Gln) amidotransferase A subunit family amidase
MRNRVNTLVLVLLASIAFLIGAYRANDITKDDIASAEKLIGLSFNDAKRDSMLDGLKNALRSYERIREVPLPNGVMPSLLFNPIPPGFSFDKRKSSFAPSPPRRVKRPANLEDVAFWSVRELGELVRTKQVASEELTRMYLERLKKYGPALECVVTLTESLAIAQAQRADREIKAGKYRGPLHGIPYGAKDLLAVKGYKTTWGAMPYKDQIINEDATVIKRLEAAGAVLAAKLTLGALAWGDVWYGGTTKNPWNYKQGSSGSSAGSASATAAGLVGFSIGSETWGSIVSPSTRCGTTGLRPTYGRVSRKGAMALSWSMDKLGPICRTVEDCALVFEAIYGPDGEDPTVYDVPFRYQHKVDLRKLRIGYVKMDFDSAGNNKENNDAALAVLQNLGAKLIPIELPKLPFTNISFILSAEAAAAFDDLTRSGRDSLLVRQIKNAWPNVFRTSRFVPAVEYIQANRIRTLVIEEMQKIVKGIDVYVVPSFSDNLLLTNLTGHPCVVVPNGFNKEGSPTSITFMGKLFDEGTVLAVAKAYQDATDWHKKHPTLLTQVE